MRPRLILMLLVSALLVTLQSSAQTLYQDNNSSIASQPLFDSRYCKTAGCSMTGSLLLPDGTAAAPSMAFSSDADGSGTGLYRPGANIVGVALDGLERFRMWTGASAGYLNILTNTTGGAGGALGFGATIATADILLTRNAAANPQWGLNGAAPIAYTHNLAPSARAGTDTDVAGANATIQPGRGTGAAAGTQLNANRNIVTTTGSTAQASANAIVVCESKTLSNTSATAQTLATIALASNSAGGATAFITVTATDGTNFDSETQSLNVSFVNKAGTMTVSTPTVTASSAANNSGSATIGATVTAAANVVSIKATPVFTTIVPTLVTSYIEIHNHGAGAVTCQ